MSIGSIKFYPKRLLLGLGLMYGVLSVVSSDTALSQTNANFRNDLEVLATRGTYLKRQINWYQQSPQILNDSQRCYLPQGERLFVSTYRRPVDELPVRDTNPNSSYYGNVERPDDYWEVTFQSLPSRCRTQQNQSGLTWFVYRQHVRITPTEVR